MYLRSSGCPGSATVAVLPVVGLVPSTASPNLAHYSSHQQCPQDLPVGPVHDYRIGARNWNSLRRPKSGSGRLEHSRSEGKFRELLPSPGFRAEGLPNRRTAKDSRNPPAPEREPQRYAPALSPQRSWRRWGEGFSESPPAAVALRLCAGWVVERATILGISGRIGFEQVFSSAALSASGSLRFEVRGSVILGFSPPAPAGVV